MYTMFVRRLNYIFNIFWGAITMLIIEGQKVVIVQDNLGKLPCPTAQADFSQMGVARFELGTSCLRASFASRWVLMTSFIPNNAPSWFRMWFYTDFDLYIWMFKSLFGITRNWYFTFYLQIFSYYVLVLHQADDGFTFV